MRGISPDCSELILCCHLLVLLRLSQHLVHNLIGVPLSWPRGGAPWSRSVGSTTSRPKNNMLGVTPMLRCLAPLYSIMAVLTPSMKLSSPSALKLLINFIECLVEPFHGVALVVLGPSETEMNS